MAILFAYSTGGVFASGKPGWGSWSTEKGPHTVRFDGSLSDSLYGIVKYGTTIQMEQEVKSKTKNKTQSVHLQNLQPNTTYFYILGVEDDTGVRTMAETADTFVTAAEGKPEIPEKEVFPAGTIPVGITIKLPGPSYTPINELESGTLKMPRIDRADLTVSSDSARATCSITSSAAKDDWVASQIEYGLAADKQPFQEQFNWGFRESWCKREALLKGLPSNSLIFFRIFAAYRKYDGVDIQAYSRPVSFQTPEKGGAAVSLAFTDIDAPRITDALLVREARSAVLSFKTTRPASVWGSYPKQPTINGEYHEADSVIPRGQLSLTHRFVFEDLKEDSVYPLELWIEDEKGAGIRLTFNMQTRPLDIALDTQDSNKFEFDSTRQGLHLAPGKTAPNGERTIPKGSPVKLSWKSSGSGCEARGAWSGAKPVKGSEVMTPQESGIYEIRCIVNGIERRKSISLTVVDPPDFTFTVSKGELAADGKLPIALEWDASFMEACAGSNKGVYFEQLPKTWTTNPFALKGSERFFAVNYPMEFSLECTWKSAPYTKRVSIAATPKQGSTASTQITSTPAKEPRVSVSSTSTPPAQFQSSAPTELPPGAFPPPSFYHFSFPPGTFPSLPSTSQPSFPPAVFGTLDGSMQQVGQPKKISDPKKASVTKTKNGNSASPSKKKTSLTFTVTKYKVKPKEKFTLRWNAAGYTSCMLLSGDGDIISDAMKQKGSLTLTQEDAAVDYVLQCFKKKKYVSKKITVTLSKP